MTTIMANHITYLSLVKFFDRFVIYVAPSCYAKCLSALTLGSLVVYTHNIPFRSLPPPRYLSPCYVSVPSLSYYYPAPHLSLSLSSIKTKIFRYVYPL